MKHRCDRTVGVQAGRAAAAHRVRRWYGWRVRRLCGCDGASGRPERAVARHRARGGAHRGSRGGVVARPLLARGGDATRRRDGGRDGFPAELRRRGLGAGIARPLAEYIASSLYDGRPANCCTVMQRLICFHSKQTVLWQGNSHRVAAAVPPAARLTVAAAASRPTSRLPRMRGPLRRRPPCAPAGTVGPCEAIYLVVFGLELWYLWPIRLFEVQW